MCNVSLAPYNTANQSISAISCMTSSECTVAFPTAGKLRQHSNRYR